MSHIMTWPDQKRISLESIHIQPNSKLKLGCWGMCPGLEFIATDDPDRQADFTAGTYRTENAAQYTLGTQLSSDKCTVTDLPANGAGIAAKQFHFKDVGSFRIVLKVGGAIWDWIRVYVMQAAPDGLMDKTQASGFLNLEVLWAVPQGYGLNYLPHAKNVTDLILARHGLTMRLNPGTGYNASRYLPNFDNGIICSYQSWGNLKKVADALRMNPNYSDNKLMVIMANARECSDPADDKKNLNGVTVSAYPNVKPFVVLNVNVAAEDGSTLLHEMCHAAGDPKHPDDRSLILSYGARRNELKKDHVTSFTSCHFYSAT